MTKAIDTRWRKSRRSDAGDNCVEVAALSGTGLAAVRDSKDRHGEILTFDRTAWLRFIDGVRGGDFDL